MPAARDPAMQISGSGIAVDSPAALGTGRPVCERGLAQLRRSPHDSVKLKGVNDHRRSVSCMVKALLHSFKSNLLSMYPPRRMRSSDVIEP